MVPDNFRHLLGHVGRSFLKLQIPFFLGTCRCNISKKSLKGCCCIVGRRGAPWRSEIGAKCFTNPEHNDILSFPSFVKWTFVFTSDICA